MAAMLLASLAFAGTLGVTAPSSTVVLVDGEMVPLLAADRAWLQLGGDRLHVVEAQTTAGRPLGTLELVVPDGLEVEVEWRGRSWAVTRIAPGRAPPPPDRVALPNQPAAIIVVQAPTAAAAAPAPAAPVVVELVRTGTDWMNVYVDGEKVAEFRNTETRKQLTLPPGPHRLEIKDFMEDEVKAVGTLTVTGPGPMKVGFDGKGRVDPYTHPGAWAAAP